MERYGSSQWLIAGDGDMSPQSRKGEKMMMEAAAEAATGGELVWRRAVWMMGVNL